MYKDVSKGEQTVARKLVKAALAKGWAVTVNNGGDEDEIVQATDFNQIWSVMGESDEDGIVFTSADGFSGWVRLVYGNEPDELVNDYSTRLEEFMKEVEG